MWRLALLRRLKRAASELLCLLAGWFIVWFVVACLVRSLAPDPATQLAGPLSDEATRKRFASEFGLDRPLAVESLSRALRMLRGEWGVSWRTRLPVREVVTSPACLTIGLSLLATVAALLTAFTITVTNFSRFNKTTHIGRFVNGSMVWLFLAAIPAFVVALWLIHSSVPDLLGLPRYGFRSTGGPAWRALVLPAFCLALAGLGFAIPRLEATRAYVSGSIWFRNALAVGQWPRRALLSQGWPFFAAALGDVFAQVMIISVTGAVAVEHVFALPGLGTLLVDAVQLGDVPVLLGVVAIATILTYVALSVRGLCAWALPQHLRTSTGFG